MVLVPYLEIVAVILLKGLAVYRTTLTDAWGRLLSYQLVKGHDAGVSTTLSSITKFFNWTSHAVPFQVITSLGVKTRLGEGLPGPNATTYKFTPYEFGSWDSNVSGFAPTKYLGTSMKNGKPSGWICTTNYDNLGLVLGTSSNLFNFACFAAPESKNSTDDIQESISALVNEVHKVSTEDIYARYDNPFYKWQSPSGTPNPANNVASQKDLSLMDGGEALQNNPIWQFLQPAREISAIIVNGNSADTSLHYLNGSEILTTYVQSLNHGLTRMPFIPSVDTFLTEGLNKRASFFGCNDASKVTIVYLPNTEYLYPIGLDTYQAIYPKEQTEAMIANGVQIATQESKEGWATCLGCALMMKTASALPEECSACFNEYCYCG